MYDNQSPPGAWKDELAAAPWGYGQERNKKVIDSLATMRMRGLWTEASILELEITALRAQVEKLMERVDEAKRTE